MEKRTIRLIALDLDGTVFDEEKRIPPKTAAALRRALEQGITVLPATGRPICGLPEAFLALKGMNYAITSNGALVAQLRPFRVLHRCCLSQAQALAAWDRLAQEDCLCDLFCDGQGYTTQSNRDRVPVYAPANLLDYVYRSREVVPDLRRFLEERPEGVEKLTLFFKDLALRDRMQREISQTLGLSAVVGAPHNLEISAPEADKGRGLLALAKALDIPPEETMACGDSGNDLSMLQAAGLAVAMGNGTPEVLAAADYITKSNQEEGVAWAIERLVKNLV